MARQPRSVSRSGLYHVIIRGVGRQILFEDEPDYGFFLKLLEKYSKETHNIVYAYCLMSNHVHLLINDTDNNMSLMMKKIGVSYSLYFNRKYDRVGHLFQDRFLSEVINTENQMLIVFRYILRNPEKAGMCKTSEYKWSSYNDYGMRNSFVDTSIIETILGPTEAYQKFVNTDNSDECLEYSRPRNDDEWAKGVIEELTGERNGTALKTYDKRKRDEIIGLLKKRGLTIRQIERLTGISRGIIQDIICQ